MKKHVSLIALLLLCNYTQGTHEIPRTAYSADPALATHMGAMGTPMEYMGFKRYGARTFGKTHYGRKNMMSAPDITPLVTEGRVGAMGY